MSFIDDLIFNWTMRKIKSNAKDDEYIYHYELLDYIITNECIKVKYKVVYMSHSTREPRYDIVETQFGRHPDWEK